jgi:hypothetical protein
VRVCAPESEPLVQRRSSDRFLSANLQALPPATRRALDAAAGDRRVDLSRGHATGTVVTADGRRLAVHASADPVASAEALVDRCGAVPLLVVIGFGFGYLLDALERRNSRTKVLAVEPVPAIARAMLSRRDVRDWITSGRLALLVGPSFPDATDAWRLFGRDVTTPPVLVTPLAEQGFPAETAQARAAVARIVAGVKANAAARRKFAGRYLLNTLRNLPCIAEEGDAAALVNLCEGMPAVIVAAGPSLDATLPGIRELQGRAVIIAVDTAVRPLLAAGIQPHMAVSVDPSDINAQHLSGIPASGMALVGEGSLDPIVLPQFRGRTFTFRVSDHHPWPWLRALGLDRDGLQAWGSVLTTAFDFAIKAGCNPLVFAGADLAYTRGLQYCRNTAYEPRWQHLVTDEERSAAFTAYLAERPHSREPDVHGQPTITMRDFMQFRDWIVARASSARDRRVLNATGGGILYGASITQTSLSDLSLPPAPHIADVREHIAAAWQRTVPSAEVRAGVGAALADPGDLPLTDWLDFGGDTATEEQMLQAATDAAHRLSVVAHASAR